LRGISLGGAETTSSSSFIDHPLFVAVSTGDLAAALAELLRGASANLAYSGDSSTSQQPHLQKRPLHFALDHQPANLPDVVDLLLCAGANPDLLWRRNASSHVTAYHLAVEARSHAALRLLVRVPGSDVDTVGGGGGECWSALEKAAFMCDADSVGILLREGGAKRKSSAPLLLDAVRARATDVAKQLLSSGVCTDDEADKRSGHTIYHLCVLNNDTDLLMWLCSRAGAQGRSLEQLDFDQHSPRDLARDLGNILAFEIIEACLKSRGRVHASDHL
jgi:hypothetical protein